jgi:chromosome segregation ATPase
MSLADIQQAYSAVEALERQYAPLITLKEALSAIGSQVQTLDGAEAKVKKLTKEAAELEDQVDDLKKQIKKLENDFYSKSRSLPKRLDAEYAEAKAEHDARMSALQTEYENAISQNQEELETFQKNFSALKESAKAELSVLEEKVQAAKDYLKAIAGL